MSERGTRVEEGTCRALSAVREQAAVFAVWEGAMTRVPVIWTSALPSHTPHLALPASLWLRTTYQAVAVQQQTSHLPTCYLSGRILVRSGHWRDEEAWACNVLCFERQIVRRFPARVSFSHSIYTFFPWIGTTIKCNTSLWC